MKFYLISLPSYLISCKSSRAVEKIGIEKEYKRNHVIWFGGIVCFLVHTLLLW